MNLLYRPQDQSPPWLGNMRLEGHCPKYQGKLWQYRVILTENGMGVEGEENFAMEDPRRLIDFVKDHLQVSLYRGYSRWCQL